MTGKIVTAAVDIAAPPQRVSTALTDPDEIETYMFQIDRCLGWPGPHVGHGDTSSRRRIDACLADHHEAASVSANPSCWLTCSEAAGIGPALSVVVHRCLDAPTAIGPELDPQPTRAPTKEAGECGP